MLVGKSADPIEHWFRADQQQAGEFSASCRIWQPKDGLHIALATAAEVDLLVSWNFKHIVHYDKIRMFNAVNLELGYNPLQIYSPREVTHQGEEGD